MTLFDLMYTIVGQVDHPDVKISYGYIGYKNDNNWITYEEGNIVIRDNEVSAKTAYHKVLRNIMDNNNREDVLPW